MQRYSIAIASVMLLGVGVLSTARGSELASYDGKDLYRRFCASCHGVAGEGDGPVSSFLNLRTPDLVDISRRNGGVFPEDRVRRIIDGRETVRPHGTREMPVWGWEFFAEEGGFAAGKQREARKRTDEAIQKLVDHLRQMQKP